MIRSVAALFLLMLTGCSSLSMPSFSSLPSFSSMSLPSWPGLSSIKPYTLDIQQGMVIDPEMIGRLKEGMTRVQVGYVLGTPLLTDPFHANRWDYVFYTRKKGVLERPHNLTVFFKDDKLQRFETDYVLPPPNTAAAASATPAATATPATTAAPSAAVAQPATPVLPPATPVLSPATVPVPPVEKH